MMIVPESPGDISSVLSTAFGIAGQVTKVTGA